MIRRCSKFSVRTSKKKETDTGRDSMIIKECIVTSVGRTCVNSVDYKQHLLAYILLRNAEAVTRIVVTRIANALRFELSDAADIIPFT